MAHEYPDTARLKRLKDMIASGKVQEAEKLAWEWSTTRVFGRQDFKELLRIFPKEDP